MRERRESVSARSAVLRETLVLPSFSESVRKGTVDAIRGRAAGRQALR
jgi:hypothetical protein